MLLRAGLAIIVSGIWIYYDKRRRHLRNIPMNVREIIQAAMRTEDEAASLSDSATRSRLYASAEAQYRGALAEVEALLKSTHYRPDEYLNSDLLPFLHIKIALCLQEQGPARYEDSETAFLAALQLVVNLRGPMSPYVVGTARQLAHLYTEVRATHGPLALLTHSADSRRSRRWAG